MTINLALAGSSLWWNNRA